MGPDDVERLYLTVVKDALLTAYQVRATGWQAVQAAGLAAVGLATLAYLGGSLSASTFRSALLVAGTLVAGGTLALQWYGIQFEKDMLGLLKRIKNSKRGGDDS